MFIERLALVSLTTLIFLGAPAAAQITYVTPFEGYCQQEFHEAYAYKPGEQTFLFWGKNTLTIQGETINFATDVDFFNNLISVTDFWSPSNNCYQMTVNVDPTTPGTTGQAQLHFLAEWGTPSKFNWTVYSRGIVEYVIAPNTATVGIPIAVEFKGKGHCCPVN